MRRAVASQKALPARGIDIGLRVSAVGTNDLRIEIHEMSVFRGCTILDAMRGVTYRTRCPISHNMVAVLSKHGVLAGTAQIELVI